MKGLDIPQSELDHAEHFLELAEDGKVNASGNIRRSDLIRLLAWYGSIRAQGRPPGELVVRSNSAAKGEHNA